jgi:hypothetical protein
MDVKGGILSRRYLTFVGKFVVVLVVCTFLIGAVSYHLLTQKLFEDPDSALAIILRTPAQPELWRQAMIWVLPVQIFRAVLIATVLYPFYDTLIGWGYGKRFGALAGLLVVLGVLAGSYGAIETAYMTRPEFVTPEILLRTLPEPIAQGLAIAAWFARWMPDMREVGGRTSR